MGHRIEVAPGEKYGRLTVVAEKTGIRGEAIRDRLEAGWTVEAALGATA
ncbi:MAG: hypothetical protein ACREA9_17515 [Pyrinomonadaceae bacterium]